MTKHGGLARLFAFALAWALGGCAPPAGVGDPCLPSRPASTGPGDQCAGDAGCFLPAETYVQTRAVECRSRVCLTYHWNEADAAAAQNEFSFCSCRCDGPGDPSTLCHCPEGFSCSAAVPVGDPGFRGTYCVRNELTR